MATTPNHELPYPEVSDPPDGAAQIQALAEALDDALPRSAPSVQVFTSSGTWNKPVGLVAARVTVVGGGGGCGGTAGSTASITTAGGGGGGTAIKLIAAGDLGPTEAVTVGTGGAGGTTAPGPGGTGGSSSFGGHCSATGGQGSPGNDTPGVQLSSGTAGGTGSGGDLNIRGGASRRNQDDVPGNGGGTALAPSMEQDNTNTGTPSAFPGGGAVGQRLGGGASRAGLAGAGGVVIVEHYF